MGEIRAATNSSPCYDGTKDSHSAYHIYDNQIRSYTNVAMADQILAGHWVAKRDGYNCAEMVNYDHFVTSGCFEVHGNHVKVMRADRNDFSEYSDQVQNCPAVYYKVVDNC